MQDCRRDGQHRSETLNDYVIFYAGNRQTSQTMLCTSHSSEGDRSTIERCTSKIISNLLPHVVQYVILAVTIPYLSPIPPLGTLLTIRVIMNSLYSMVIGEEIQLGFVPVCILLLEIRNIHVMTDPHPQSPDTQKNLDTPHHVNKVQKFLVHRSLPSLLNQY